LFIQTHFDEEILKWMCISWVFDWREIWDTITVRAKIESNHLIIEEKLPIPKAALRERTLFS
jgi:hypothetical protein